MRRPATIILTLAMMLMPAVAVGHAPEGTDTNTIILNDVWSVFGPGCSVEDQAVCDADQAVEDEVLGNLNLQAETFGGTLTQSTVHATDEEGSFHESGAPTHVLTGSQCNGLAPDGSTYDATLWSDFPYYHSDLENGIFEATGSFFVPFEVLGPDAGAVEELHFGYAHTFPWPASSALCTGPFPLPGAYYEFYRGDTEGADGWEIPINTLLVPDMAYGAIVRALDANGNTVVSGFVYANVNNYLNEVNFRPGSTPQGCATAGNAATECNYHDVTPPFPTVKGARPLAVADEPSVTDHNPVARCADGVLFSFGEPVALDEIQVSGEASNVQKTAGPDLPTAAHRDVDAVALFPVTTEWWGPEVCVTADDTNGDGQAVITIEATDPQGNYGIRTVVTDNVA